MKPEAKNFKLILLQIILFVCVSATIAGVFVSAAATTKEERILHLFLTDTDNPCTDVLNHSGRKAGYDNLGYVKDRLELQEISPKRFAIGGLYEVSWHHEEASREWYFLCDIEFDQAFEKNSPNEYQLLYGAVYGLRNPFPDYKNNPFKK